MKKILFTYISYVLITSFIIFFIPRNTSKAKKEEIDNLNFYGTESSDRTIIFDKPLESALARLYIIENAKETLDVAYFSIEQGETSNVFFGALFDAADRGVKVNILLDGIFHGLRFDKRSIIYAIDNHENMHLKFYEKINLLNPLGFNNRMHDKYIIADNDTAIIGGRNIGDKYFNPAWYQDKVTNDCDVVILSYDDNNSVIKDMKDYFNEIFNHKYSKDVVTLNKSIFRKNAANKVIDLQRKAAIAREEYKLIFDTEINLKEISKPTNKISFIHNPISRFKEPWLWDTLISLFNKTDEVFIQSPYTIPNYKILHNLDKNLIKEKKITLLTNSLLSTPNLPAFSGYLNHRKRIVKSGVNVLELQSYDSLHSKAFLYDNDLLAIGSFNLDPRSAFLSTESMVVIHSEEVVEGFGMNIHNFTDESLLVGKDYKYDSHLEASLTKKIIYKFTSYLVRLFENLL